MSANHTRREAALTLPVRLLSRLVGRNEAHSSKNDEMRARYRGLPGLLCWLPLLPVAAASFVVIALLIGVIVGGMAAWDFYRWTVRPLGGDAS